MKKPRSDSNWDRLPEDQQLTLERWLFDENMSYKDACVKAQAELSVVGSVAGLSRWYQGRAQARLLGRITASAQKANAVVERFKANPAQTFDALSALIGQLAFEQSLKEGADLNVETLSDLASLVLNAQALKVKEGQLELARDKFEHLKAKAAQAEQAEQVVRDDGTAEEKQQKLRAIFGMA